MSATDEAEVHRTVERVARESYGRLLAYLSVHTRDLAGAEDALSEALLKALTKYGGGEAFVEATAAKESK